jgi:hypothetical protein
MISFLVEDVIRAEQGSDFPIIAVRLCKIEVGFESVRKS